MQTSTLIAISEKVRAFTYWTDRAGCPKLGDWVWTAFFHSRKHFVRIVGLS
jgi:hypothetical protein